MLSPEIRQAQYLRSVALSLDTETTGVKGGDDEVIELGVVSAADGAVLINQRYKPTKPVGGFSFAVHGISTSALQREPRFADCWASHMEVLRGRVIVGWNIAFDRRMIEGTCAKFGLPMVEAEWVDLMPLYRRIAGLLKNCKLTEACRQQQVQAGTHSAVSDALAVARVLYKIAGKVEANDAQEDLFSAQLTHTWEVAEVEDWYSENPDGEADNDEDAKVLQFPTRISQRLEWTETARLLPDGTLAIPMNALPKYRYWMPGGQPIRQTLIELGASDDVMRRYCGDADVYEGGV